MTLVILAAGMDSRFGGVKQMEPIDKDGNFIIDYSVFDAKRAGFDKVVFIIKEAIAEDFKATIGARVEKHIAVEYAYQEMTDIPEGYAIPEGRVKPWGTTHAVRATRNIVKEPYGVINADDFYGRNTYEKLAAHLSKLERGEFADDGVCRIEDGLCRAVILLELYYPCVGICSVKAQNIFDSRSAEAVNALVIVTNYHNVTPARCKK